MFTIDLLRRRQRRAASKRGSRERTVILVAERIGQRRVVVRCCERSARAGVRAGLPVSEALALLPGGHTQVEEHAPEREAAALRAVAIWARRFSPMVAVDEPDGLLVDVAGSARVFGSEGSLAERVVKDAWRIGLQARVAVASTFGCARAVARWGASEAWHVIADGGELAALVGLPVCALGIDEKAVEAMEEVGVERIGQLMELSRAALPARFGEEALRRLDEALGQAIEAIEPVRLAAAPEVERVFDGPTTQLEAIELTMRELLDGLCHALRERESGARLIEVELERSEALPERLNFSLSAPSREARHLWSLIRPKLERVNMGFGVERIVLRAPRLARLRHEQMRQWNGGDGGDGEKKKAERDIQRHFGEFVDTLINRIGAERVLRVELRDSHIPERAFAAHSAATPLTPPLTATSSTGDRPFVLFEKPIEAAVICLTPDGPVLSVRFDGAERRIVSCVGPERICGEWWRGGFGKRDYFKAQEESGRWLWVCRACERGADAWFVNGIW